MDIDGIVAFLPYVMMGVVVVSGILIAVYGPRVSIEAVENQLEKDMLEPISVELDKSKSTRNVQHVDFTARSKSGETIDGYAKVSGPTQIMHYPPGFDRFGHLRSEPVQESTQDDLEPDIETQIRRETARRLDLLQADKVAFLAHDSNEDGKIDSEEWNAVRARVETEVREELSVEVEFAVNAETSAK